MRFSISPLLRRNFNKRAECSGPAASNSSRAIDSTIRRSNGFLRHFSWGIFPEIMASHCWRNSNTRASRLTKNRLREVRRRKMKASSRPSATMAAMMALKTRAAGPSLHNFSKMDPIAQPKTRISPILRTLLIADETSYVLSAVDLEFESSAVGLRGESPDLIDDREVLRACGEEDISGKLSITSPHERKSQPAYSGWLPFRARTGESAARAHSSQRKGPISRKIKQSRAVNRQNPRCLIPIPVLFMGELDATHEIRFANSPSVI